MGIKEGDKKRDDVLFGRLTQNNLAVLYEDEGLMAPELLSWPMEGEAEKDRLGQEEAFASGFGKNPPPGMEWMKEHVGLKYRPDRLLEGCRGVLVSALSYYRQDEVDHQRNLGDRDIAGEETEAIGRVARFARGRDYHKEFGNRLRRIARKLRERYAGHGFRAFTDAVPLDETWLAEASGLGFKGRNTLVIMPSVGSWAVLGHILTTCVLERESPMKFLPSCPEGCTKCIDACPTKALSWPGKMDASRCISCHTIEQKGVILQEYREPTGNWVFGCDICQEVCPFNKRVPLTRVEGFQKDIAGSAVSLRVLLLLKEHDDLVDYFAGSQLLRAKRAGLVRNACTVAGNLGDQSLAPLLKSLCDDEDEGVRVHAKWALARLKAAEEPIRE